jgi:hypothetical protein
LAGSAATYAGAIGFWAFLDKWQTLITGVVALFAAGWTVHTLRQQMAAAKEDTDRQIAEDRIDTDRQIAEQRRQFHHQTMVATARDRATIDRLLLVPLNQITAIEGIARKAADQISRQLPGARVGEVRGIAAQLGIWLRERDSEPVTSLLDREGRSKVDIVRNLAADAPSDERELGEGDLDFVTGLRDEASAARRALERVESLVRGWVPDP